MKYTRPTTQTMATGEGRTYCFFPSCLNFTFFIHEKETQKRFDFILILKTNTLSLPFLCYCSDLAMFVIQ